MPARFVATDYRLKARNCRYLAASAEAKIAKHLFFLAKEYDAAAHTREQSGRLDNRLNQRPD